MLLSSVQTGLYLLRSFFQSTVIHSYVNCRIAADKQLQFTLVTVYPKVTRERNITKMKIKLFHSSSTSINRGNGKNNDFQTSFLNTPSICYCSVCVLLNCHLVIFVFLPVIFFRLECHL